MYAEQFGKFVVWVKTNQHPGFYEDLGPFFGSRTIEKELGAKIYDDPDRQWVIIKDNAAVAAIASIEVKGSKAYFKNTYVMPQYRDQGLYTKLCTVREDMIKAAKGKVKEIYVTAKEKSSMADNWISRGYEPHSQRGSYIVFRKEVIIDGIDG